MLRFLAAGLLAGSLSLAPAADETFQWRGRVPTGKSLEIKGVNGAVRAERATGVEVSLVADKHGRRSDPRDVRIDVVEHADGVTICAVYPSDSSRPNECKPGSAGRMNVNRNDVNVDFTVQVPDGVHFVARTVNGDVEARALSADVDAQTVNGKIRVASRGRVNASTVNGGIEAATGGPGSGTQKLSTVNGSVTVDLAASVGAEIDASTVNGRISSDVPMTIRGRFSGQSVNGTVGGGGGELQLRTVNGSIHLRRGI